MAMTKIKGLQMWCRKMTDGYPNVSVDNFTTAWRNGLAFCAIIHRFRPDLIDFDSLSSENVLYNNKLAFEIAEKELGIPAFLEADDMARLKVPDKLSVITYVSQYYNFLHALPQLGGPGVKGNGPKKTPSISGVKRGPDDDTSQAPSTKKTVKSSPSPTAEALKQKSEKSSPPRQNTIGDKCAICLNKVYLLERHIEEGKLYHRSCFRHSELSPTNRVLTRSPFMSPSLNSEKVAQENHNEKRTERDTPLSTLSLSQGDNIKGPKDTPITKDTAKSNLSSVLKRVEGAGMKHSIGASEREENFKKSKFQPRSQFESKDSAPINKPSTDDMGKRTDQRDKDSVSALPLSSKEARKLEKRRQEIIDGEKAPKANVGTKRAVPLIFQQKDSQATTSAPSSSSSTTISTSSTAALTKPSTLTSSDNKSGLSSSNCSPTANERSHPSADSTKSRGSDKESMSSNVLRKQSAPGITSLQQKFSVVGFDAKSPVAKPRLSAAKETPQDVKSSYSINLREKDGCPKPAPRKSFIEPTIKKVPPERPNYLPRAKPPSSAESSSADERSTPRSSSSTSPPPLPTSPPPSLPLSQPPSSAAGVPQHPPPLPTSPPPSLSSKDTSSSKVPTTNTSSSIPASTVLSSVKSSSSQVTKTTATGRPSKTPATKDVSFSHKPPQTHQLSSSSALSKEPPVAVLVTPTTKKDESVVLSGLLTSLAGIRGRSSSTPNAVEVSIATTSSVSATISHPSVPSSLPSSTQTTSSSRKYSEPFVTSSLKPNVSTGATTSTIKVSNASSVVGINLKPTASTSTSSTQLTNSAKTTNSKSTHPEKIPEALSVLSSLKPVSSSDTSKTSKPQSSSSAATNIEDKTKAHSLSDSKPLSHNGPKTVSNIKMKTATEDVNKSNSSSKTKENSTFLKDVHLKRVMPEPKTKVEDSTSNATPFNIALKKVEPSLPNAEPKKSVDRFHVPGDIKTVGESNKTKNSKPAASTNQRSDSDDNIPQWKKDIEERKKRLREDIARAEAKTPSSFTKCMKERPKSADILSLIENSQEAGKESLSSVSESPRSDSSSSSVSSSSSSKRRSKSIADISSDAVGKLDWQLEAERRIAAFALFDSSEDESKSSARKTVNQGKAVTQQNKPDDLHRPAKHASNGKNTLVSEPKNSEAKGNLKPPNHIKQNAKKNNCTEAQSQLKESGGFRSKVEFRAVDVNISCEDGMEQGDKNPVVHYSKDERQGQVTLPEPLSISNKSNMSETPEVKLPEVKLPTQGDSDKTQTPSAISSITNESTSSATSDNESLKENKTGKGKDMERDREERSKDKEQDITTSPKLKRKITFLGKLDSDTKSPPPLRKITVDREFDFDKNSVTSSEFESSLSQSTSKLTLNDEHTPVSIHPPQRPPRPKSQRNKTPSPRQISAIELQQQLMEIDSRLTDLELRGRDLEDSIRNVNTLEEDDEELMIQWFSLVREKNDLVREEADLVYLSREQDLEDEQHQIDVQLRYLMNKEENVKSPQEKEEEDYLLQRKLDIVNQRSSIVDSMDEDRLRYEEEDRNIEDILLEKGLIRNASGSLMAKKGLKVAKSKFYA